MGWRRGREGGREEIIPRSPEGLRIFMGHEKTKTRFTKLIRIDPEQYQWVEDHKDTRTNAGFLDKIINNYKKRL